MAMPLSIRDGEQIRCQRCDRPCIVETFEWEVPVQVIKCRDGIHLVGIDHETVPQHVIVDYRQLDMAI